jgi:CheY-like chemotaxis protein
MGETKIETTKSVPSKVGQPISKRILVAEDDKTTKEMVARFLVLIGFEVALARNGLEALFFSLTTSFDLVLTDLEMPIMDGWSLASCIKEGSPNTPVVLMTGADRETVVKKVERQPVDSVLFKPFGLKDLQRTVEGALELREGVLNRGNPLSSMNPDSAAEPAENHLYALKRKI